MFRKSNIAFIVFVLVSNSSANGGRKPQSAISNSVLSDKASGQLNDQTFNINNWGFGKADRNVLTEMNYKIDALYGKSPTGKGKLRFQYTLFFYKNLFIRTFRLKLTKILRTY